MFLINRIVQKVKNKKKISKKLYKLQLKKTFQKKLMSPIKLKKRMFFQNLNFQNYASSLQMISRNL